MIKKLFLSVVILLLITACGSRRTDWSPYFESQHKTPYGTEVFYEQLEVLFDYPEVEAIKTYTDDYLNANLFDNSLFIYINPHFYPTDKTLAKLNLTTSEYKELFISTTDEKNCFDKFNIKAAKASSKTFDLKIKHLTEGDKAFNINNKSANELYYFDSIPSYATVLGTIKIEEEEKPNYIVINNIETKTRTFIHSHPELFTNYYMLNKADGAYALNCTSHLSYNDNILWDGYGTSRRYITMRNSGGQPSLLRYIFSSPALSYALLTLASLVLLFLLINHKRIIRVAPVLHPVKNSSLAYVNIIAALFENEKNKSKAAQYRTNYILDRIKEKYFLDTSELDEDFLHSLSVKSGVRDTRLKLFIAKLKNARVTTSMSKTQFIEFNESVEDAITILKLNQ